MKVYISADIEGVAGITSWDEARKEHPDYPAFQRRMTREVAAAAERAVAAGAREVWVKDAHATGRNLIAEELPRQVRLIRGWSGHPLSMVQELDESFAAVLMVGYHAAAGSGGNPLAHTMSSARVKHLSVNGRSASEFLLHTYAAALFGVPVVFVSGDAALAAEVAEVDDRIARAVTMEGIGASTVSVHPEVALDRIRAGVDAALEQPFTPLPLPEHFEVALQMVKAERAYRGSHYPGAVLAADDCVRFAATDWLDVMRFLMFVI